MIRNGNGQSTLQLILPLMIVLFLLLTVAVLIPRLSTVQTMTLTAGIIVFVISFTSTEAALFILIFSMLLSPEFIVGQTGGTATLGRGITLRVDDFILIIIGFSWLAKMSIHQDLGLFLRTPVNRPIAFYLIVSLLATLFGTMFERVELKSGFFFILKYFEYVIVYFMVVNHLETQKQVKYFLWALILTGVMVSVIGLIQIPGGGRVTAPFEGTAGEPNTLGGYLVFMIAIATGLLMTAASLRRQALFIFLIALFSVPLLYTQSRSSYLALIPALLIFVWLSERKMMIVLALLLIGLTLPLTAPKVARERISYTFNQGRGRPDVVKIGAVKLDTSLSARLKSWRQASTDWIKHPLLGYGVTGYRFIDAQYVRQLLETGLIGLLFFLFLLFTLFREAYRVFNKVQDPFNKGLSLGFLAGFTGLIVHAIGANTFIIVRIMEPFWFVAGMVLVMSNIEKREGGLAAWKE